ncbi:branched-chain amino acid transport system substrate-binding protein [Peteryoungia aggregata LMG 23059]|uniref:Branched-chain amino acid transport system substrate-binding protein n=1 Tax=Peteryoungia aggregata LMG 23059 TaxID=1368425 RepID=A0ABU0G6L2_9HYPH|nr:ABC transporter substrate-binding protein [Peteryoungia aggregata]MDQ0420743.1 branched-chain amino acid transport system substrate-binding protein [Peteryoungia aggregata LMG 23059]
MNEMKVETTRRKLLQGAGMAAGGVVAALAAPAFVRSAFASGDTINIGWVNARSGPLSAFAEADEYVLSLVNAALTGGVEIGGKTYAVNFVLKDTQSDPVTGSKVAKELISSDMVDIVMTSSTPETINPVADASEAGGVPCISTVAPWEAVYFGRGAKPGAPSPFKWTYHFSFGASDFAAVYADQWSKIETNKKVGVLLPNDADGNAIRAIMIPALEKAGFTVTDAGPYENGLTDFSAQISTFLDAGVEIVNSFPFPPDFPVFWRQAAQRGLAQRVKIMQVAKAGLFEPELEVLGELGNGIAAGAYWHRAFPFVSPVTGKTCSELADGFEEATGKPWSQQVGAQMALFDATIGALKASGNPKDKAAVAAALASLKVETATGIVDFTAGPVPNCAATGLVGTQWMMKEGGKFPFTLEVTSNVLVPDVPITAPLQPFELG